MSTLLFIYSYKFKCSQILFNIFLHMTNRKPCSKLRPLVGNKIKFSKYIYTILSVSYKLFKIGKEKERERQL